MENDVHVCFLHYVINLRTESNNKKKKKKKKLHLNSAFNNPEVALHWEKVSDHTLFVRFQDGHLQYDSVNCHKMALIWSSFFLSIKPCSESSQCLMALSVCFSWQQRDINSFVWEKHTKTIKNE